MVLLQDTSYGNFSDIIKGEIKIVKLSDKKIRLDYTADLLGPGNGQTSGDLIKQINLKVRYKIDSETGIYNILWPKPALMAKLSNEFRVKMKYIHCYTLPTPALSSTPQFLGEIGGYKISHLIQSIYITDEVWYKQWKRESKLKNILSEDRKISNI